MKFYGKFVAITNLCFLIFVILRSVETRYGASLVNKIIPSESAKGSIVVLAVLAIIFNFIYVVITFIQSILKNKKPTGFVFWFNLVCFLLEVWYMFFKS